MIVLNTNVLAFFIILFQFNTSCYGAKRVKRIVGGILAASPPPDDPVVFARAYSRNARIEGFRNTLTGLYSFLGIRFAHPPVGADRFRRPRFKRLEGDVNATMYGQPCPQPDPATGYIFGAEDCLWLNVFTLQMPDETTGLPVILWIHGGGYRYGSANQYGPDPLTAKGLIFVPIQYRLGTLGLLSDGTTEFSGNAALFDMAAALRWVSEYIQFFGGDPKQITVMGHGSGSTAATLLTTSRVPREMVSGVVAMSGTPYTRYTIDTVPEQSTIEIASINKCGKTNETELVDCLRAKDFKDIIKEDSKIQIERLQGKKMVESMTGNVGYAPVVEGSADRRSLPRFLEEDPKDTMSDGTFKKVPLLTGVTKDETANGIDLKDIQNIFSSVNDFLKSLISLPLNKAMNNLSGTLLPGIEKALSLPEYLLVPENLNVTQVLSKVVEATTDALFNLPALLTTQTWSKVAPAYLYSFEYIGAKQSKGSSFLNGLPLVSSTEKNKNNEKIGHGDELGYLFDVRDIFGKLNEKTKLTNASDKKVRDIFTNLIKKFAYLNYGGKSTGNKAVFEEFNSDGNNFIRIAEEVSVKNDFRFCQLSLWGASLKPSSKDTSCAFIIQELASSLLGSTGNITSSLTGGLTGALNNFNIFDNKNKTSKNGKQTDPGTVLPKEIMKNGNTKLNELNSVSGSTNTAKNNSSKNKNQGNGLLGLGII